MATATSLVETVKSVFLQRDGGRMDGSINFSVPAIINQTTDSSYTTIRGGTNNSNGARLVLCSMGDSEPGYFKLYAHNGTNYVSFTGKPNGDLTWNGKKIVCVESYKSGNSWYRKYADGWIEQGGSATTSTTINATTTKITFTTPFTSTINILGGFVKSKHNAPYGQLWFQSGDATLTGFVGSVVAYNSNGNANHASSGGTCYWYASGY